MVLIVIISFCEANRILISLKVTPIFAVAEGETCIHFSFSSHWIYDFIFSWTNLFCFLLLLDLCIQCLVNHTGYIHIYCCVLMQSFRRSRQFNFSGQIAACYACPAKRPFSKTGVSNSGLSFVFYFLGFLLYNVSAIYQSC